MKTVLDKSLETLRPKIKTNKKTNNTVLTPSRQVKTSLETLLSKDPKRNINIPSINVTDGNARHVLEIISAIKKVEQEEINKFSKIKDFIRIAINLHKKECKKRNEPFASVKFHAKDEDGQIQSLRFTQPKKCKTISAFDFENSLRQIFGTTFNKYFSINTNISINLAKLSQNKVDKIIKAVKKILGDDMNKHCNKATVIIPTSEYYNDRILEPDMYEKLKETEPRIVKLADPSFTL